MGQGFSIRIGFGVEVSVLVISILATCLSKRYKFCS
jgi:hypothetical protein